MIIFDQSQEVALPIRWFKQLIAYSQLLDSAMDDGESGELELCKLQGHISSVENLLRLKLTPTTTSPK